MVNRIDYFEIGSPDPAVSRAFYGGPFDWEIEETPRGDQPYLMVDEANGACGTPRTWEGGNWAIFYVHVADVAVAVEQAVALGASVAVPLVDNGQIYFAHLLDPLGNRFAIWQPRSSSLDRVGQSRWRARLLAQFADIVDIAPSRSDRACSKRLNRPSEIFDPGGS